MTRQEQNQLAADSLGLKESIVMGTAGAAPTFSLSAAIVTLIAAVGVLAPASILYCGIMMFGISLAFIHLNKIMVNAGASYAWVSTIFGRYLGFLTGWALLVSSTVFMVSATIPAATATLQLVAPQWVNQPGWVTAIAAIWLSVIAVIAILGIKPVAYLQVLMTGLEALILSAIIIGGLIQFAHHSAHTFSLSWLSLTRFTPTLFATGALTAVFLYWGWDVTLNLNEETKNTEHVSSLGALGSLLIIILLFVCASIVILLALDDKEIQRAGTNILFVVADKIFPSPWSYLAILGVILSSIGTLQTTIVQFTRTLFAKGRDGVINERYSKLHKNWSTPWLAILMIWFLGLLFLFLSSNFSTVSIIIKDSVNAIGFQIAFYYSLTGFACAWYYRNLWKGAFELFGYVLWPTASSLFLIFIACFSVPTFDLTTNLVGLGGLVLGVIPLLLKLR